MSRFVKELMTTVLKDHYAGVDSACVVDLTGLDVQTTEKVRGVLREQGARLRVVKNRLARQAFADGPLGPLGAALEGPCALVVSEQSIIDAAKALAELAKEHAALTLKQALVDGDPALLSVAEVAKMRSKSELLGEVALLLTSPARRLAGCLAAPQAKIAGCLKAVADKEPEAEAA